MTAFRIIPTAGYERDIERLQEFLIERELQSEFPDETVPLRFAQALDRSLAILDFAPHTCRRCEAAPIWRELVVPFGQTGCVVLFEIQVTDVLLLAARAQREDDYR